MYIIKETENFYYHVTPTKNIKNIFLYGIRPTKGKVFLTNNLDQAVEIGVSLQEKYYNWASMTILKIPSYKINGTKPDKEFRGAVYISYIIQPKFIEIVGDLIEISNKLM